MKTLKYILFLAVALAMLKYHANIAYLLGIGGRVVPAATSLDRFRDEAKKSVVVYRMGEIEGEMVALHKTATDPTLPIEQRETALAELEKQKSRAEEVSGVTAAKKAVKNGLGGILNNSISSETQARLRSLREVGWSSGAANNWTTDVKWFQVSSVETGDGNRLVIRYPWYEGVLQGNLKDHAYKGKWVQSGGSGKFELIFNPDFSRADGWWATSGAPNQHYFFALK